jgi:hypothetical protein
MKTGIRLFVIYHNPSDFPGKYVVREWTVVVEKTIPNPRPVAIKNTLEDARQAVPQPALNLGRYMSDDPVIVETWMPLAIAATPPPPPPPATPPTTR